MLGMCLFSDFRRSFFFSQVVETQQFADSDEDFALEGAHSQRDFVDGGLVHQFQGQRGHALVGGAAVEAVSVEEPALGAARAQPVVFGHAHHAKHGLR